MFRNLPQDVVDEDSINSFLKYWIGMDIFPDKDKINV